MKTILVIPAYNEGAVLGSLVRSVLELPAGIVDAVVVVDDGSTVGDDACLPHDPRVRRLRHARNEGKARSLIDGMRWALEHKPDRIVTMDGDGQHRVQDIPRLLALAQAMPRTIIVGARLAERDRIPGARYRANRFANFWIAWASGHPVIDSQSGFRTYPAELLAAVLPGLERRYPAGSNSRRKGFVFDSEMLIEGGRLGYFTEPVLVPAIYETKRASHFRPVADITQIVIMVTGHLLRRGLYPQGLWNSLRRPRRDTATEDAATPPGQRSSP